jgi:hypothetical protein
MVGATDTGSIVGALIGIGGTAFVGLIVLSYRQGRDHQKIEDNTKRIDRLENESPRSERYPRYGR